MAEMIHRVIIAVVDRCVLMVLLVRVRLDTVDSTFASPWNHIEKNVNGLENKKTTHERRAPAITPCWTENHSERQATTRESSLGKASFMPRVGAA